MQIKTALQFLFLPIKLAKFFFNVNIQCYQVPKETGTVLYCWQGYK